VPACRIEPGYQEIQSKDIACTSADGVTVRVIAGHAMGVRSPVCTRTPTMYLDFTVRPRGVVRQPVLASWNAFAYVLEGEGVFGAERGAPVGAHHLLLLGQGDGLEVWNKSDDRPLRFLLIGGEPIGEPVAQLGPFVMNTEEEIDMTVNDFECYANGFEKARHCKSQAMVVGAHVPPPIVARSCGCRRGEEWACVDAEELKPLVDHRDPCTDDSDEREAIRE